MYDHILILSISIIIIWLSLTYEYIELIYTYIRYNINKLVNSKGPY